MIGNPAVTTFGKTKTGDIDCQVFNFKAKTSGKEEVGFYYLKLKKKKARPKKKFGVFVIIK